MKEHNKLVRDRIPEIIEKEGRKYQIEIMDEKQYVQALREKVIEEAHEIAQASPESLISEIADLFEVIENLILAEGITIEEVQEAKVIRRNQRGSFTKRIKLLWTE